MHYLPYELSYGVYKFRLHWLIRFPCNHQTKNFHRYCDATTMLRIDEVFSFGEKKSVHFYSCHVPSCLQQSIKHLQRHLWIISCREQPQPPSGGPHLVQLSEEGLYGPVVRSCEAGCGLPAAWVVRACAQNLLIWFVCKLCNSLQSWSSCACHI